MTGDGAVRAITELFFRDETRSLAETWGETISAPNLSETVGATKALGKFLACLSDRQNPTLLDLGPVVGSNVEFFGERLNCKLVIEDLYADLERLEREEKVEWQPYFRERFQAYSVDGVLCWDIFDHLEPQAAAPLARELSRVLKPGGRCSVFSVRHQEPPRISGLSWKARRPSGISHMGRFDRSTGHC